MILGLPATVNVKLINPDAEPLAPFPSVARSYPTAPPSILSRGWWRGLRRQRHSVLYIQSLWRRTFRPADKPGRVTQLEIVSGNRCGAGEVMKALVTPRQRTSEVMAMPGHW